MKHCLLFSFFLLAVSFYRAQDYFPLKTGVATHYSKSISSGLQELHTIMIDSIADNGAETKYYNYRQIALAELPYQSDNLLLADRGDLEYRSYNTRSSWISVESVAKPNNDHNAVFKAYSDWEIRDLQIHYQAPIDSQWIMLTSASRRFWATVDTIVEMNILGTMDSVKIIRLHTTNLSNVPVSHVFNNKEIWISKSNGFVKGYQFCYFPDVSTEFNLVGIDHTGVYPLTNDDIPRLYEGDQLVYRKDKTRTVSGQGTEFSTSYAYQTVTDLEINGPDWNCTSHTINFANYPLNSYDTNYQQQFKTGNDFFKLTGQCSTNPYINKVSLHVNYLSNGVPMVRSFSFNPGSTSFGMYWESGNDYELKFGAGNVLSKIESSFSHFDETPWSDTEIVWTLVSHQSDSVPDFGSPVSPFNAEDLHVTSIDPCTGLSSFDYIADLWADSVRTTLSDGYSTLSPTFNHTFSATGNYQYSVEVYSFFGDTILTTDFHVGDYPEYDQEISFSKYFISCSEFGLVNETVESDSSFWILPDESIVPGPSCTHAGFEAGNDTLYLANYYGFCSDTLRCIVHIDAMSSPVTPEFPLTEAFTDLTYFKLNNNYVYSNSTDVPIVLGAFVDSLMHGCYQFTIQEGQSVNVKAAAQSIGWDDYYYDRDYSMWIDYNNDGSFATEEMIFFNDIGWVYQYDYDPWINVDQNFIVSSEAVLNTPLRMRIVPDTLREGNVGIDFAVVVTPPVGLAGLSNQYISFAPNPASDFVQLKLDAQKSCHIEMTDQSGKKIWAKQNCQSGELIDMSGLASGIYLLRYQLEDGNTGVFKLCKQ